MSWIAGARARLAELFGRAAAEERMQEEIRFHLEMEAERLVREQGLGEAEARRRAVLAFGAVEAHKEELRAGRGIPVVEALWRDVRYGARMLRRSPGWTAIAVLTLALGLGANTALFSAVRSVLLRPLPYPAPDRIVVVWQDHQERGGIAEEGFSLPEFAELRARSRALSTVAAVLPGDAALMGEWGAERVAAPGVSHEYFALFGARPAAGRLFRPGDETPAGEPLAVLSHDLWRRRFGADPRVVGRSVVLDGEPFTVVGVAEAGFRPPEGASDLWTPLRTDPTGALWRFRVLQVYGRLGPDLSLERAREDLSSVALQIASEHPERSAGVHFRLEGLHERVVGSIRTGLWVLLGAAGLVLLLACANLANLLLARAGVRERELAIRAALGAGRGRLARQLLTESLVLACLGGLLGVGLAHAALRALVSLAPAGMPRLDEISIDGTVLLFSVALTLATALAFGLAPAVRLAWTDLRGSIVGTGSGRGRAAGVDGRGALVVAQVAIALVLLVGAALLTGSLVRLLSVEPGFETSGVLTAELRAPRSRYPDPPQVVDFYDRLEERVRAIPGVRAVGSVTALPLAGESRDASLRVEGREGRVGEEPPRAHYRFANPGYFETLGIALRAGRAFSEWDRVGAPGVAVVNETLARRLWPGANPIGQRISPEWSPGEWVTVVGVIADIRHAGLDQRPLPEIFFPAAQLSGGAGFRTLVVRVDSDPLRLAEELQAAVWELDAAMPVENISTLESRVADSVALPRAYLSLFGLFAILALGLAALGIYGVLSTAVVRRTREIGVRMALGARRRDVLRPVLGRGLVLTAWGASLGLLGALALTRAMRSMLYGITPTDPLTFAGVALLLVVVALLASYLPARRAARVDPMIALRHD